MMHQTANTLGASQARTGQLLWLRVAEGGAAIVRWLRPLMLQPQQFPPDAIEQLRLERMRARLSHDDLRASARRIR